MSLCCQKQGVIACSSKLPCIRQLSDGQLCALRLVRQTKAALDVASLTSLLPRALGNCLDCGLQGLRARWLAGDIAPAYRYAIILAINPFEAFAQLFHVARNRVHHMAAVETFPRRLAVPCLFLRTSYQLICKPGHDHIICLHFSIGEKYRISYLPRGSRTHGPGNIGQSLPSRIAVRVSAGAADFPARLVLTLQLRQLHTIPRLSQVNVSQGLKQRLTLRHHLTVDEISSLQDPREGTCQNNTCLLHRIPNRTQHAAKTLHL
ncbi:hypothetical protein DL89DRAFT_269117 [Linderina pennispora]|uniref:Uncharacterized protein n=1 Tax=Linderina pennispora TaxID=61395 RepID=A0A1Y1W325_9FUNG|nr:uncharacterized protein DL89DRAFT_269117 [Linderina pennispora]ORX67953.1 hypothetical protein DL89DRAFT_269117 [Linderina pennispora]